MQLNMTKSHAKAVLNRWKRPLSHWGSREMRKSCSIWNFDMFHGAWFFHLKDFGSIMILLLRQPMRWNLLGSPVRPWQWRRNYHVAPQEAKAKHHFSAFLAVKSETSTCRHHVFSRLTISVHLRAALQGFWACRQPHLGVLFMFIYLFIYF